MNKIISRRTFLKIALLTSAAISVQSLRRYPKSTEYLNSGPMMSKLVCVRLNSSNFDIEIRKLAKTKPGQIEKCLHVDSNDNNRPFYFCVIEETQYEPKNQMVENVTLQELVFECEITNKELSMAGSLFADLHNLSKSSKHPTPIGYIAPKKSEEAFVLECNIEKPIL